MNEDTAKALLESRDKLQADLMKALNDNKSLNEQLLKSQEDQKALQARFEKLQWANESADHAGMKQLWTHAKATGFDTFTKFFEGVEKVDFKTMPGLISICEELSAFKKIGTVVEIKHRLDESADTLEAYLALGSPEEIQSLMEEAEVTLEAYLKIGKIEALQAQMNESRAKQQSQRILDLSKHFGINTDTVKALCEKLEVPEVERILKTMTGREAAASATIVTETLNEGKETDTKNIGSRCSAYFKSLRGLQI